MAMIDHSRIIWKNGEYIPDGPVPSFDCEGHDNYTITFPFEYGIDGNITKVSDPFGNLIDIHDCTKWYRDECCALYMRDGIRWRDTRWWTFYGFVSGLKWAFHKMIKLCYEYEVGVYKCGDTEVYIFRDQLKQSYVSFYKNNTDAYVVLGGYGHYENVYCHFMARGYGEEFEKKMASEAYRWVCDGVLREIANTIFQFDDLESINKWLVQMWKIFKFNPNIHSYIDNVPLIEFTDEIEEET